MEIQNLWPDFPTEEVKGPKTILKEQAQYLTTKTKSILSGDIMTTHYKGVFTHSFYVVAPSLDEYRYKLFSVKHGPTHYPLIVTWDEEEKEENAYYRDDPYFSEVSDEEEFIRQLSVIFSDERTIKVISSLLSESISERGKLPF